MPRTRRNRKSRALGARLTVEQKETIDREVARLDLPLSDSIAASALQAAETVTRQHREIELSAQDSLAFAEAILNPRTPNDALRAAIARHDRLVLPPSDRGSE